MGFHYRRAFNRKALGDILKIDGLDKAYRLFEDQMSRVLVVKLLAYRILGNRHVRLPRNNPQYWELRRSLGKYVEKYNAIPGVPVLGSLDLCNIEGVRLYTHPLGLLGRYLLEQYRCPRAGIGAGPGDIVVDAGGGFGDTALHFAQHAAKVFCFECIPANIVILQQNLALNPDLGAKIALVQKALWSRSGEKLVFEENGPGSRVASGELGVEVETETIDDFVEANSVGRVDFIKMDIEGAEPDALAGAERTIRKYRPRLAICVYHDLNHLASIPNWVAGLGLGYRFWLDHFTIHLEETVLFAKADSCG